MKLLCLSNGHGEDVIALRILTPLCQRHPELELAALPITGAGTAYRSANIPLIGPAQVLPSGGFLNRDPKQLARDLNQGLLSLTRSQLAAIKAWAADADPQRDSILAVGDIVPLLFAHLSGLPYSFIGTAKSEYWLRDERGKLPPGLPIAVDSPANRPAGLPAKVLAGARQHLEGWSGSVYLPWERWLMARPRCRAIFVRDALTARHLQRLGLKVRYAGNPMMDNLVPTGQLAAHLAGLTAALTTAPPPQTLPHPGTSKAATLFLSAKRTASPLTIALLPGSRPPEAYENWANIVAALPGLAAAFPQRSLILLAAIAPSLSIEQLKDQLPAAGTWQSAEPYPTYQQQNLTLLLLSPEVYADCLDQAQIAVATAGTATEQFVGLGKPAITLPGNGPQFTPAFATVQAKMLGPSIQMVQRPEEIGPAIAKLMSDPDRLQLIYQNGKHRMGEPGGGQRIAEELWATLSS